MSLKSWWKQHFTLGIIFSGALASLVCTIGWELVRPERMPSIRPYISMAWEFRHEAWAWMSTNISVKRGWHYFLQGYFGIAFTSWTWRKISGPFKVSVFNYTTDNFFGMIWRWEYDKDTTDQTDPVPFCPTCGRQLVVESKEVSSGDMIGIKELFHCRNHGKLSDVHAPALVDAAAEEVRLKLRNGTWKQTVRSNRHTNT